MLSTTRTLSVLLLLSLVAGWPAASLRAQDAFQKQEQALVKQCVKALSDFANTAKRKKVGPRAKQAFDLILEYDPDNKRARRELQFRKVKDAWVAPAPDKRKRWRDKASYEDRFDVLDEWAQTAMKLSEAHTKFGKVLEEAGEAERAGRQFAKAVYYHPMNKEANLALGYEEGPGFFGTAEQIALAKRMKEVEMQAVHFARKEYEVQEISQDDMPEELVNLIDNIPDWMRKPSFDIHGAKSKRFTIWVRGSQEHANTSAQWAERAVDFGVWLLGEKQAKRLRFVERATQTFGWWLFLGTNREREEFLKANPEVWQAEGDMKRAMEFANNTWRSKQGVAQASIKPSPRGVQDGLIAGVFFHGLVRGRNEGMGQGIVHAATWYMKSTSMTTWGARAEGTVADDRLALPESTNWWMRSVRNDALSNQDWAADQTPRERLSRFRNQCRLKTWSFTTWLWAAYPDKWLEYYLKLPKDKIPTLEEVNAVGKDVFGNELAVLDAQWREWARGDSGVAYGTGYGRPLLPRRPSDIEIAALEQMNLVRSQQIGYTWPAGKPFEGAWVSLSACELDAETSIGCFKHATYVTNHPELVESPEAGIHEENPAHDDFSRQGQQAGGGNIVTRQGPASEDFARESVDGWISAVYHRLPMLVHNIKRIGYSHVDGAELSVSVLDSGSLMEPYDPAEAPRLTVWPANGMKKVPTHFGSPEWPNPLEDQPEGERDVTKCGYVVSVQFERFLTRAIADADIELWEARKGGRPPKAHMVRKNSAEEKAWTDRGKKKVDCYKHTPRVPLNKKRDLRNALFAIPKEPLKAGKHYQARVQLRLGNNDPFQFIWEFTCGRQKMGLKLK